MPKKIEMVGLKFNRWIVLGKSMNQLYCKCLCVCGNIREVRIYDLLNGKSQSCGCLQKEKASIANRKHDLAKTLFYAVWKTIKQRCLNPQNVDFKYYGGRGIEICNRWCDFISFKNDMYDSYLAHKEKHKTTTIERKNNNGNYCFTNCCWTTCKKQAMNKRHHPSMKQFRAIAPDGTIFESDNQHEFARKHILNVSHLNNVLKERARHHKNWIFNYV